MVCKISDRHFVKLILGKLLLVENVLNFFKVHTQTFSNSLTWDFCFKTRRIFFQTSKNCRKQTAKLFGQFFSRLFRKLVEYVISNSGRTVQYAFSLEYCHNELSQVALPFYHAADRWKTINWPRNELTIPTRPL